MRELFTIAIIVLRRELRIYMQHKSECVAVLMFFVMVVSLFPIATGPLPENLTWFAPCIIWVAALLAAVIAQESSMRADSQLGVFEQIILSHQSFSAVILSKILANWLVTGLPLILITPLLALCFNMPLNATIVLCYSLLLGTPILSLVGTLGVAMTLCLPRSGILLATLVLPLYMPVLVLGVGASLLSLQSLNYSGHLALLAAFGIVTVLLSPLALKLLIKAGAT